MGKSPGHQKWPQHKVLERPFGRNLKAELDGILLADSDDVLEVAEDRHPPRYYFPRADVRMDLLRRSDTVTECPFKGTAHYYNLVLGDHTFKDAAWSYEDPFEEHRALSQRLAFYDDKYPELRLRAAA